MAHLEGSGEARSFLAANALQMCETVGCNRLFRIRGRHTFCCSMCTAGMNLHSRRCRKFHRALRRGLGSGGVQNQTGSSSDTCVVEGCRRLRNFNAGFETCCSFCVQSDGRRHSHRCTRAQPSASVPGPAASTGSAEDLAAVAAVAVAATRMTSTSPTMNSTETISASSSSAAHGPTLTAWNTSSASLHAVHPGLWPAEQDCSVEGGPADADMSDMIQVAADAVQNVCLEELD